jgi:hypothetical protein
MPLSRFCPEFAHFRRLSITSAPPTCAAMKVGRLGPNLRGGKTKMCDYSLHAVPNRLAVEGEELITHRFMTGSIGLASPADIDKAKGRDAAAKGKSWWSMLMNLLNPPPIRLDKIPAVCIPPGARLRMTDIPHDLQRELNVERTEEVTFVELSASAYRYRDGLRFDSGHEMLLQYLDEGLHMDVLSLGGSDRPEVVPETILEEDLRPRVRQ